MKLDQIPKKNPFHAPEGYFDKLPGIVQSRMEAATQPRQSQTYFGFALRYALPALVLLIAGTFWLRSYTSGKNEFETELASIDAQNLEVYLKSMDIYTDELIETADPATIDPMAIGWSPEELEVLENSVYTSYDLPDSSFRELLDVYEAEPVKDSVQ